MNVWGLRVDFTRAILAIALVTLVSCAGSAPRIKGLPKNLPKIALNGSSRTPKHNMSGSEYPFDEKGNYMTSWVASGGPSAAEMSSRQETFWRSSHGGEATPAGHEPALEVDDEPPLAPPEQVVASVPPAAKPVSTPPKPKPTPKPKPKPKPVSSRTHTVKSGDTLYSLSRKYGTTVSKIQSANGLSGTLIRVGQKLKIP
jgi:hypothetical protein